MEQYFDHTTKLGTVSGTLLTVLANIRSEDVIKTTLLAGIGAVISFSVTLCLKAVVRYFRRRFN